MSTPTAHDRIRTTVIRGNATVGVAVDRDPDLSHVAWDQLLTVAIGDPYPDEAPYVRVAMTGVDRGEVGARRHVFRSTTVPMPGWSDESIILDLRMVMATIMVEAITHGTDRECCPRRDEHPESWDTDTAGRAWQFRVADPDKLHDRICSDLWGAVPRSTLSVEDVAQRILWDAEEDHDVCDMCGRPSCDWNRKDEE